MRRYIRDEQSNDIYDREKREWITVLKEETDGGQYTVNKNRNDERHIDKNEIEERR